MKKTSIIRVCFFPAMLVSALLCITALTACNSGTPASTTSNSQKSNTEQIEKVTVNWSTDSDCTTCHKTEASSMTDPSCQIYSGHQKMQCIECHIDTDTLAQVHSNSGEASKAATRLKKTSVTRETCLGCHEKDYTPEITSDITVLTDSNGLTVNPHGLPVNDKHAAILCSDCHKMHVADPIDDTAPELCVGCHHESVYECGTCHE